MDFAIITGVTRGLGFALAKHLLANNFHVVGVGRSSPSELHQLSRAQTNSKYDFVQLDLQDSRAHEIFRQKLDALQLLHSDRLFFIHNAASAKPIGVLPSLDPDCVAGGITINLTAPIQLSQVLIARAQETRVPTRMVFVSSGAASRPIPGSNVYCIAKAGLEMLVQGIHSENAYSSNPVECVGFRPGVIDTEMQAEMRGYDPSLLPVVEMYRGFQAKGQLRSPDAVAKILCDRLLTDPVESGKIYNITEFAAQ